MPSPMAGLRSALSLPVGGHCVGWGLNERAVRYSEFSGHEFGFILVRDETALANNFEEEGRRAGRALFFVVKLLGEKAWISAFSLDCAKLCQMREWLFWG